MRILTLLLVALGVAVGAWFARRGDPTTPDASSEAVPAAIQARSTQQVDQADGAQPSDAAGSAVQRTPQSAPPAIGSDEFVYALERNGARASEIIDALVPLAQQGNAAAIHALRRTLDRCRDFVGDFRSRARVLAPAGSEDAIWQAKVIEIGKAFCGDISLRSPAYAGLFSRENSRRLRERGDEVVLARSLMPDALAPTHPTSQELVERRSKAWDMIRHSGNPYAVDAAMAALAVLPEDVDDPTWQLSVEATEFFPGDHKRVRLIAAMWYACELGADCRPYGTLQQSACLHQRNCAPNLGLQDFIRQRLLTPAQFAAMQRYLDVIRAERARVPAR
jgi:hypothetical protein